MRCIRTFFKCGLPVLLTATVAGSGCRTSRNLQSHDRQSLRDTTATVRSEKDKGAEQLTDDWENWEIVRTEYVLKGRDTVPDTMQRIPAGIKRVTRVRGIRHSTSVNKKEEQEKTAQSVRLRRTESQTEIAKTVKKSSAGRIALYAIGLVALWLALRSIGKWLL